MKKYYVSGVARDLLEQLRRILANRFAESVIWHRDLLIQTIRNAPVYPTFKGLSVDSIMAVVVADPKVRVVGDYICYSSEVT